MSGPRMMLVSLLLLTSASGADNPRGTDRATLQAILAAGFQTNRQGLAEARKLYNQARAGSQDDARLRYAWGLVLRKHNRHSEAERAFAAAAQTGRYLPAVQAVIWLRFADGQYADGFKRLDRFVETVAGPSLSGSERAAAAGWVGRAIGALELVKLERRDRSEMHRVAAVAERRFAGELRKAYDKGMESVRNLHRELEVQALKARILAHKAETDRRKRKSRTIAGKQSTIAANRKTLKKTAGDWKEWLDASTKGIEKDVDRLMKEMARLEERRQSISRSYFLAQAEWNRLANVAQAFAATAARTQARTGAPIRQIVRGGAGGTAALEQQIIRYFNSYMATVGQMERTRRTAAGLLARHRRNVQQYETATGDIARTKSAMARWEKQLQQQEQKLKTARIPLPRAAKRLQRRIGVFSTYVPFDADDERNALLKEFAG